MQRKIVIIGATSAIATHCARQWALSAPDELVLAGRNESKLSAVASDLRIRSPKTKVSTYTLDFTDTDAIQGFAAQVNQASVADIVLIAHGTLPDQAACESDLAACESALNINALSVVLFAEAFAQYLQSANAGTLAMIGSVAGDRGRKSNYVYGAAKGLVTRYVQGLQHRFASTKVKVILIKPGPTNTPMTAALVIEGQSLASVESVAQTIVQGVSKGHSVIYAPRKWSLIMMIVRHLPSFIFNKLDI